MTCATTLPSARALGYTAPSVSVKHTGFGDPSHSRRSSRAPFGQRLFYVHALRMAHMAYLFGGPCGDTREGVPVPTAGSPTPHGLPPSFGDGCGRFPTCSVGVFMANTLTHKGRISAPTTATSATPTQAHQLFADACNCAAMARWYTQRGNWQAAARKTRQHLAALRLLAKLEGGAA